MKEPVPLSEFAYRKIKDDIMTGKYQQGEKLSAGDIAGSLSISPTPVKEALNRLVSEGLIEAIPRHGMVLKKLSVKEIRDMLNVRTMIETYSAPLAVKNRVHHPEALKRMAELLPLLSVVGDRDYSATTKLEQEFHGLFVRLSENDRLISMYENLWGVGFAFYVYSVGNFPMTRQRDAYGEHSTMYEYLLAGDAEALASLMESHMQATIELLESLIATDASHFQV